MAISPDKCLLKSSPSRSVLREPGGIVLKRFHHPGLLGRIRDRQRAQREATALLRLRQAGLPAPRPLGVSRADGTWELRMEEIPGARSLEQLLRSDALARRPLADLAASLGKLLAQLEGSGLHHPDLHAGNLLVDDSQELWLVDPARLSRRPAKSFPLAALVLLAAGVREISSPAFRRHFLESWWERTPEPPASTLEAFAEQVESQARARRLEHVQGRLQRWLRRSGASAPLNSHARRGVRALAQIEAGSQARQLRFPTQEEARTAWLQLARLREHHLPVWPPSELELSPTPAVGVNLPPNSRELSDAPDARRLGELLGALHDRGLGLDKLQLTDLVQAPDGKLMLGPVLCYTLDPKQAAAPRADWQRFGFAPLAPSQRAEFESAYLRAHRCGAAERQRLRRELDLEP